MKINFFEATRQGARQSNQDAYTHVINQDWCCFVVADGLGGHQRGDIASQGFCEAITQVLAQQANEILKDATKGIDTLIYKAATLMRHKIKERYANIDSQTTFALLWLDPTRLITAHMGDSRVYRLNTQKILWRTPDHTPVQALYEEGLITEEDFNHHPMQNRLLKALNLYEDPEPEIFLQAPIQKDETLLLCSDGFWNTLSAKEILKIATTKDLEKTAIELIDSIEKKHPIDADNITIQCIRQEA